MRNKKLLVMAIVFQVLILVGMFVKAFYPLYVGTEVTLRPVARDPRDLFQGDYVALNYSFNTLHLDSLANDIDRKEAKNYKRGDVLYVQLSRKGKHFEPVGVWREIPASKKPSDVYMKALVDYSYDSYINVRSGIESYFTDSKTAQTLEKLTSWQGNDSISVAVVIKVADNGAARIKELVTEQLQKQDTTRMNE